MAESSGSVSIGGLRRQVLDATRIRESALRQVLRSRVASRAKTELGWLEFKRDFSGSTENWCKLLVELVAMANSTGGLVVFGVADNGELIGVQEGLLSAFDVAKINDKLSSYSPNASIQTSVREVTYYGKRYIGLRVDPSDQILVFDKDGSYQASPGETKAAFNQGVVYVRKGGSKRPANQVDINRKSRRLAEQISSEFVARVEQVAAIPLGSDLVAVDPDRPGFGVKLVEAGQGIPVSLQEESEVALPISELINADTPYSKPANEVGAQVRMWHTDSNHRVGRRTLFRWFQRRNQVEWTSQFSEFCILSACSDHAYPLFWASKLSRNRLARLIREMMRRDTHPEVAVVPYLIAGFYWSDRNRFLDELETSTEYKSVMASIRKIRGIGSQNEFLTGVRSGGSSIAVADERVNKNELLGDPSRAGDMLETVVQRRLEEKATDQEKSSGHQLDILAHCQ